MLLWMSAERVEETYFSNLASTSATTARPSMALSTLSLCSNRANMFLLPSIARPQVSFFTTWDAHKHTIVTPDPLVSCGAQMGLRSGRIMSVSAPTSPAVVWELMVILQDPPPWQCTMVVISWRATMARISSCAGTCSRVRVFFRESRANEA